jgi:DNA-binding beta-propeller fold protein YncE
VVRIAPVAAGQLAATIPAAGASVAKGATIKLVVSSGTPQLAYDDGQTIHVINSATLKASGTVPPGTGPAVEASWSPDGTHVIYSENGQLVIDQPDVAKAVPFQLTAAQPGVSDLNPAFAPTLKALIIAFVQRTTTGAQLCVATIGRTALSPSCTSAPGWDLGGQVEWSPDGSTILVLGTQNAGNTFGLIGFTSKVPFSTKASDWGTGTVETATTTPDQGVFAGAFSPDGKHMALVSNVGTSGFFLYIVPSGDFKPTPAQQLPVPACQIAWRSDGRELAVMQPNGPCGPDAIGTIVGVKPAHPHHPFVLATQAAHPAWQPIPAGG